MNSTSSVKAPRNAAGKRLTSVLMAGLLVSTGATIGVTGFAEPAAAQGFFKRLFNPESAKLKELNAQEALVKQAKKARVSAPRYFTYKPDRLQTISLAKLATVKTAAVAVDPSDSEKQLAEGTSSDVSPTPVVLSPFDEARSVLEDIKIDALSEVGEALIAYYREHPNFIWIDNGRANIKAGAARRTLAAAEEFALDSQDYFVSLPAVSGLSGVERDKALMTFEMQLSAAVMMYMLDAERGRVDPNRISGYHDLPRHKVDLVAALNEAATAADLPAAIEAHNPQSGPFKALKNELAHLRAQDKDEERIVIAPGTFLKAGRSSPEVKNIVAAIKKNGSPELKAAHAETLSAYNGEDLYSAEIAALVKGFQKENKLSADGIIGKNTILALVGVTNAAKIAKVELAMERTRWLPEELGERKVFINQPAFTATYTAPGEEPLSMRVVVGKKSNQTNFFYDKIEVVEYNPYWGVPYSIIVNEMLPKLAKNPGYLDAAGYEVSTVNGRKVSSASVDWYAVATKKASVNVRQYPGARNALGELKILFPNKHHIYMHDTPSKSLFKKDSRAFSHGCVRLHDPRAMAAAVLGKSKSHVASEIAKGQNHQEKVSGDIPVYVSYFTAWPEVDGTISYFNDVYDRDRYLIKAIDATEAARS
ncbi:MAG: L,D-transpeptidase family protein [Rhodobacteraceae bacterium]|nr:L,D-transpeptidase family protein [Paracoccaceae bacterium]